MSMKLTAFSYNNECMQGKYIAKYFMDDDEIERNAIDGKGKETEEEKKEEPPYVGFISLFRYSSGFDKILVIFSTIIAVVSGASIPAVLIVFGTVIDKLIVYDVGTKNTTNQSMTTEQFLHETSKLCTINAIFGFVFVFCNYVMVSFFSIAAANQAFKIRCLFMKSVLKQDISWYDTNETGDFASRITSDLTKVQDGIAEKLGICISFVSSTILCTGTGLYYSWKLALVVISISPVKAISMAFMTKMQATVAKEEMQAYGTAGAVAEEVLSSIRTVVSFGGERKEIQRYDNCLIPARKKGIKRGLITAISSCITWITISAGYALAFWYGIKLILAGSLTGGSLVIVFFNVMSASTFIGQTAPYFEAFATARGAAAKIFSIIDRQPLIDSSSDKGMKPESVNGTINIRNVHFKYPARPTVPVLKGVSLDVHPGETVALVGPSGCGKSTIIQLILRFYDTNDGAVELDGNNVSDLNVGWLRDHIGLVGQEPVLFSTTIAENIRYGKRDASDEEIENAAEVANAHEFIQALPLKYDTLVGERGIQLSGGQKQRIAIARALIKNPKILLLDEATSALDTESESVVQAALDKARQGRTTIVVAHRLSTIRTADKIVVLSEGEVKEVGTHENLMNNEGIYYNLVQTQTKPTDAEKQDDINDKEGYIPSLNSGSIGFANSSTGAVQKQISSESIMGEHQVSAKPAYNRQSSKLSAYGNQLSTNSAEKDVLKTEDDEDEIDKSASVPHTRLWKTSAQDWPYALIGAISAILMGLHFPVYGIIFGSILGLLSGTTSEISEQANTYCIVFALMAISSGLCSFLQAFMFSIAGEKLTSKLRKMIFANIITQDIEFFDNPKNSVGSLCSRLTSDASSVQGAAGSRMSTLLQASSTVVASIILAMWFNYKIGLVVLSIIPIAMLGAYFEGIVITGASINEIKGAEDASKVAIEAIESIRTVASLHQEETFFIKFQNFLLGPHKKSRRQSHVRGLIFGLAQGLTAFSYAACMYYGSVLVANKELHYANLMKVLEGVLLSAMMLGQAVAFAPDYQRGKFAAVRIFKLLDLKPKIDAFSNNGRVLNNVNGYIRFKNVHFIYSSRPKVKILNGLDLEIEPGKTVALVGSSGCGKSTCVQLIERFYDTQHGSVVIDNEDVKEMNVSNLRSHIGLVSQEPILFSYSIADNIAYGDNSKKVEMNEIIAAARQANIHNFIITLPQGYHTPVGNKGTHLSGGQKQRVAIARALLRNPKILLLDEATSALDAESEKIVQDALDKARSGRTCLIIAHRLSTVQNADAIMVIHEGKIVEQGTHQELLNKKGHYYNLHNVQSSTE